MALYRKYRQSIISHQVDFELVASEVVDSDSTNFGAEPRTTNLQHRYKVSIKNLDAWFGVKQALKNIGLDIKENTATAIIGPSGCGKTTLIRCLNRMHEMTPGATARGSVVLDDIDIYDNVAAGLKLNGIRDKGLINDVVQESLEGAALWDEVKNELGKPGIGLSGGQQQRLCIARALAMHPEVLLMDEPTSALDPIASSKIEELIHNLKKDLTIIIVTHNMQQAARVSDHTAFMYLGELIEYGPTKQIFENPQKELTERYISGKFG